MHDKILILDFGSQVTQLIARRVREAHVYCEIHPNDVSESFIRELHRRASSCRQLLERVDLLRVDHFRGFEAYWEIPADEETAVKGRWVKGPGEPFFSYLAWEVGSVPFIAEDLGVITDEVIALRDGLELPGMKILQFAFGSGPDNAYLPFNFENTHSVIYTGTHDNDTLIGWYESALSDEERQNLFEYVGVADESEIHWALIRYAMSSVACLSIFPVQDILGLPSECRMNTDRIIDLLNNLYLLASSKLKPLDLFKNEVDFVKIASSVAKAYAVAMADQGIKFTLSASDAVPCRCDETLIRRTIENLLDNAVKYTGLRTAP